MNIVLFGPPGAGKGTQAENLVEEFKLFKVSTGDLLRDEIKKESSLGKEIKSTIDRGNLVSNNIIDGLVQNVLSSNSYANRLIFDGYPRNINQAKYLDLLLKNNKQKISCVLSLKVDQHVIVKRLIGRQICAKCGLTFNKFLNPPNKNNHLCDPKFLKKRSDDTETTAINRFETYKKESLPIVDYYQNQKLLHEIYGMGGIGEIYKEIRQIIHSLKT